MNSINYISTDNDEAIIVDTHGRTMYKGKVDEIMVVFWYLTGAKEYYNLDEEYAREILNLFSVKPLSDTQIPVELFVRKAIQTT